MPDDLSELRSLIPEGETSRSWDEPPQPKPPMVKALEQFMRQRETYGNKLPDEFYPGLSTGETEYEKSVDRRDSYKGLNDRAAHGTEEFPSERERSLMRQQRMGPDFQRWGPNGPLPKPF